MTELLYTITYDIIDANLHAKKLTNIKATLHQIIINGNAYTNIPSYLIASIDLNSEFIIQDTKACLCMDKYPNAEQYFKQEMHIMSIICDTYDITTNDNEIIITTKFITQKLNFIIP